MYQKQISIFIENKPGRLAEVTDFLAKNDVNIYALSIADTTDFGILRLIVNNAEKAMEVLKNQDVTVKMTDVIAIALKHKPSALADVLKKFDELHISIEYMYAFTGPTREYDAMVILRVADQERSVELMKKNGIQVLEANIADKLE